MKPGENMYNFTAEYNFVEYPKWVTLANGSAVLVHNANEESVLTAPDEQDEDLLGGESTARAALFDEARALGLDPHHRTGEAKLLEMIKLARGE